MVLSLHDFIDGKPTVYFLYFLGLSVDGLCLVHVHVVGKAKERFLLRLIGLGSDKALLCGLHVLGEVCECRSF